MEASVRAKSLAFTEGSCWDVAVGGSGAASDVLSSWRENSCDSDPRGGEHHSNVRNAHIKTQLDSTAENVNDRLVLVGAGGPRGKQHSLPPRWINCVCRPRIRPLRVSPHISFGLDRNVSKEEDYFCSVYKWEIIATERMVLSLKCYS